MKKTKAEREVKNARSKTRESTASCDARRDQVKRVIKG
jgi:hypothetical protein